MRVFFLLGIVAAPARASLVAHWDFEGENPEEDRIHGYRLLQSNASASAARVRFHNGAAIFGRASTPATSPAFLWAPRGEIPYVTGISGPTAKVTVVALVQLSASEPLRGGAIVGGVWE